VEQCESDSWRLAKERWKCKWMQDDGQHQCSLILRVYTQLPNTSRASHTCWGGRWPRRLPWTAKAHDLIGRVWAQVLSPVPGRHFSCIRRHDVVIVISRLPLIARQPLAVTKHENTNNQEQEPPCSPVSQKQLHSLRDRQTTKQAKWVSTLSMLAFQRSVPRTPLAPCSRGENAEFPTLGLIFAF
jgi:hypothetical protein